MNQPPRYLRVTLQVLGWSCFFAAILTPPLLGKGPETVLLVWAGNLAVSLLGAIAYWVAKRTVWRRAASETVFQTFSGFVYALVINGVFLGVLAYLWIFERA